MEWLGLILLYIISGYMKKRQQMNQRREIEKDPDWAEGTSVGTQDDSNNIETLLNDLFESNPKIPESPSLAKEIIENENKVLPEDNLITSEKLLEEEIVSSEDRMNEIDEQVEEFGNNIYHSKLSEKKELQLGNKWTKKRNIQSELFDSKKSLKKSIILKEVLGKPLSLRK